MLVSYHTNIIYMEDFIKQCHKKQNIFKGYIKECYEDNYSYILKNNVLKHFNKKKGPQKVFMFYKMICKLYRYYPQTVKRLLDTVPEWGYYKDYFFFLLVSEEINVSPDFECYIYNILTKTLRQDELNYANNKDISTLAKWLPRQNNSFDKHMNFIDKFSSIYFEKGSPISKKIRYRKLTVMLNKYLDTTEIKLCEQNLDDIDFNNVPVKCRIDNKITFMKNDNIKDKYSEYLKDKYKTASLTHLINMHVNNGLNGFEKTIINEVWETNKTRYIDEIKEKFKFNFDEYDVLLDLSQQAFNGKLIINFTSFVLVLSELNMKLFVNCRKPYILDINNQINLCDKIDIVYNSMIDSVDLNIEKIKKLTNKKIFIITCSHNLIKDYENDQNIKSHVLTYNKKIKTLNNKTSGKIYEKENSIKLKKFTVLKKIFNESYEFNAKQPNMIELMVYAFYIFFFILTFINFATNVMNF